MSENKSELGQEPAFPKVVEYMVKNEHHVDVTSGMSKRFYAACCVLQNVNLDLGVMPESHISLIVERAYKIADELLKQE